MLDKLSLFQKEKLKFGQFGSVSQEGKGASFLLPSTKEL